jgi:hypothetical protein
MGRDCIPITIGTRPAERESPASGEAGQQDRSGKTGECVRCGGPMTARQDGSPAPQSAAGDPQKKRTPSQKTPQKLFVHFVQFLYLSAGN